MKRQSAPFVRKQKTWLHSLLVLGIFLYLYSPLLDHWLGNETYSRLHTHVYISEDVISQYLHNGSDSFVHGSEQDQHEHEEGVLCFLDNDVLLLAFTIAPEAQLAQRLSLSFELVPFYLPVSIIHLSSLDPPPTI